MVPRVCWRGGGGGGGGIGWGGGERHGGRNEEGHETEKAPDLVSEDERERPDQEEENEMEVYGAAMLVRNGGERLGSELWRVFICTDELYGLRGSWRRKSGDMLLTCGSGGPVGPAGPAGPATAAARHEGKKALSGRRGLFTSRGRGAPRDYGAKAVRRIQVWLIKLPVRPSCCCFLFILILLVPSPPPPLPLPSHPPHASNSFLLLHNSDPFLVRSSSSSFSLGFYFIILLFFALVRGGNTHTSNEENGTMTQ
ncbi:hypothetical protein E2C01_050387 [Portunus trituberculatus]|uniref:Uncharacterized protein n=1 Tax=Portunus trituberculatus TaxID=210409 RepID=A0A5B7GFT2_PORTR|nr:hypothetical protein [Portunus trituberculatus]